MTPNTSPNLLLPQALQRGVDKKGWRILGPGGGGAMYIPTIKPDDPDTALVACDMTGSYITHNGGETWMELNFKAVVNAFTFDPSLPATVYAGATGLYRSQDAGDTWELVFPNPSAVLKDRFVGDHGDHFYESSDNWPGGKVQSILVDPENSALMWVGIANTRLQVFVSTDSGGKWAELAQVEGTRIIKSYLDPHSNPDDRKLYYLTDAGFFLFSPKNNTVQRLSLPTASELTDFSAGLDPTTGITHLFVTSPGKWQQKQYHSGTFHSSDQGNSWVELNSGLDADMSPGQVRNLNRVAVCPNDARVIYLSAVEPTGESNPADAFGIFKSDDNGTTWKWVMRMDSGQPKNRTLGWIEMKYDPTWGGAPFFMSVAPSNPDVCYSTDWGTTYRTADGGLTWQQLYCEIFEDGSISTRGLDVTNIYEFSFDPFDPDHIALACTDIGLLHSKNGGKSWSHTVKGVPASFSNTCYRVLYDPQVKGRTWAAFSNCHDMPRPKMFRGGHFEQFDGGIVRSENGMESWELSNRGLPARCVPTDIVLDPASDPARRTLYAALVGKGVFKSIDGGQSWVAKNKGITPSLNAWRLVFMPDGSLYLLVCRGLKGTEVIDGALYLSTDGAESWKSIRLPEGVNFPNDLCYDPGQPSRLYLACWPSPVDEVEHHGGLWKSEDGGSSWVNLYDESSHTYGVAVDPHNPSTLILTTFEARVLRSDDHGQNWKQLEGFDYKWPKNPIFDPYNPGMIYFTTFGSSVWYGSARA